MKSTEPYFTAGTLSLFADVRAFMEREQLWQIGLVDEAGLSKDAKDKKLSDLKAADIRMLWRLALLPADVVHSSSALATDGLVLIQESEGRYIYQDRRRFGPDDKGLENAFAQLEEDPQADAEILFHPFRAYLLYRLHRALQHRTSSSQYLWNSDALERLLDNYRAQLKSWFQAESSAQVMNNVNDLIGICVACEPTAHQTMFNRIRSAGPKSMSSVETGLEEARAMVDTAMASAGKIAIEHCRSELCQMSEEVEPNKNLHLIVRLMKAQERERHKGHIAGAMLLFCMAESLRRNFERSLSEELPEEDETGFGSVSRSAKQELQGAVRILDGRRDDANQFLRRFGLDHGIRVNVYVEGATEHAVLDREFSRNSSVLLIDLKGQFIESRSKGLSFRESLRNDLKSKTFSLILLDNDRSDNVRVVQQAARADEICGQFYLCDPDFEFANFTVRELCEIASTVFGPYDISELLEQTKDCTTAKGLFVALKAAGVAAATKGELWGRALCEYGYEHPTGEFGEPADRIMNRLIRTVYQCCTFTYETTRRRCKVDPESGQLVPR